MQKNKEHKWFKKSLARSERIKLTAILLLIPAIIFILGLIAYPISKVIIDAFNYRHLINKEVSGFAGLENFRKVINDQHFMQAVKNSFVWTIGSVVGEFAIGLLTAVLLNQKIKGVGIFRTAIFLPWLVPIIVAGMTWNWMLNPDFGIINYILKIFNIIKEPINFLGEKKTAMATVIFVNIWRTFPYYTISFLSALQSVSHDMLEAAALDGAGIFKRFFKITFPQIKPVALVLIFVHIVWTSINFDFIWVLTEGGPNYATETLPLMIYRYSMKKFDIGAASALSTMILIFMTIIFIFYYRKRIRLSQSSN